MKDFKYVYGPVPSRRMGLSLGISPIPDGHCNYSCIYCQLGRTRKMTNTREIYFDYKDIIREFKLYLKDNVEFDVLTIVGEGEPLLYKDLGILIRKLKKLTNKPIAVITNGALLSDSQVREELKNADIVLPSLDADSEEIFKEINRPSGAINYDQVLEGLEIFSKDYQGQLWIETMIVKGLNDNKEFFLSLKEILSKITYHKLYINSPVRPPAEKFVEEASKESIDQAIRILGGISIDKLASEGFHSKEEDDYQAVLSIVKRHPMNQYEIKSFIEQRDNSNIEEFFDKLNNDKDIEIVNYKGYNSYRIK